jgi:pimeloyl-ACP methyl ester carboxylesterase
MWQRRTPQQWSAIMSLVTQSSGAASKLDPREEHHSIPSPRAGLSLFLRHLAPKVPQGRVVLYVHGGTFPSALSIAHRFDGRSWRDVLCEAGFDVWGLDFHGFGLSDPYPEMTRPADESPPLGRTEDASRQLEAAVRFICKRHDRGQISLIAHSWGSMVAGRLAGRQPELVDRLVFFGPITWRAKMTDAARLPGWRLISLQEQWDRFTQPVPSGAAPVLCRRHFDEWGEQFLDADRESRTRSPAAVKVPCGAFQDIFDAWDGQFAYDPMRVQAPVAIVRGEWDNYCTDADAHWLFDALSASPSNRDIKIIRGTHLLHLEAQRYALYRESIVFLSGGDEPPLSQRPVGE